MKKGILSRFRLISVMLLTVAIGYSLTSYMRNNISDVVSELSESTVRYQCVNAVNAAAHIVIEETMDYHDLVNITYDSSGDVSLIAPNTVKINRLARDLANMSQKNVDMICDQSIQIPLGAFTGSVILSGLGRPVNVRMLPLGSVVSNYSTAFETVGINQTRHSIYINILATVNVVLPINSLPIETLVSVLVCENVLVGRIPEVYVSGTTEDLNYLDLIPE